MLTVSTRRTHANATARRVSLADMFAVYRERRALSRLDDRALSDIGLTREEAELEVNRPIWDVAR